MADDDLELNRDVDVPALPPPETPGGLRGWVPLAIVLALVAGGLARWWTFDRRSDGEVPATAVTGPQSQAAAGLSAADGPPFELPPFESMDPFLRTLIGGLTSWPGLAEWLATDDLLLQMASAIDRLARGGTPAGDFKVLAPRERFSPAVRGRTRELSSESTRRYDAVATALAGIDPVAVARAYRTIRPRLDEAYQRLGRSDASVDRAVLQALDVLIATPVPAGPVRLVEGRGPLWNFEDPSLEALPPAQKQLLRMGPANAARVVATLREVRRQLQP